MRRVLLLLLSSLLLGCSDGGTTKRSLLLVTVDTWRFDHLGSTSSGRVATEALDRLARKGRLFDHARAHVPLTLPEHAVLMTGLLPPRLKLHDNTVQTLRTDVDTLATLLSAQGYATAAVIGGQPLARGCGLERGFTTYSSPSRSGKAATFGERNARTVVDEALELLEQSSGEPATFLWVHCFDPHFPYQPPGEGDDPPDDPERYRGEVEFVDQQIGRLLDRIATDRRRWLVAITADHGEGLGDYAERTHGYQPFDSTLRVPLIVAERDEGGWRAPAALQHLEKDARVRHVDFMPTVLGLLGLMRPADSDGVDLSDPRVKVPDTAYLESLAASWQFGWSETTGLRTMDGLYLWTGAIDSSDALKPLRLLQGDELGEVYLTDAEGDPEVSFAELRAELRRCRDEESEPGPASNAERLLTGIGYLEPGMVREQLLSRESNAQLPSTIDRASRIESILQAIANVEEADEQAEILEAGRAIQSLIDSDPGNPSLRFFAARCQMKLLATEGHDPEGYLVIAGRLLEVIEIAPRYLPAHLLRCKALALAGQFELAIDEALRQLSSNRNARVLELIASLYAEPGTQGRDRVLNPLLDRRKASDRFLEAIELSPEDRSLRGRLVRLIEIGTQCGESWVEDSKRRLAAIPEPD